MNVDWHGGLITRATAVDAQYKNTRTCDVF